MKTINLGIGQNISLTLNILLKLTRSFHRSKYLPKPGAKLE